jgi:hypothetical protein
VLLVSGELPPSTKLPAQLELTLPSGSELQWAGEILGGESLGDPEAKYTVRKQGDHSVYTLTLTKSRTGQIEAIYPGGYSAQGGQLAASIAWIPSQDVPEVRVAVSVPQGANILSPIEGAQLSPPQGGGVFYYRDYENVKANEPVTFSFTFEQGSAPTASQPKPNSVVPFVLALVGLVLVIVTFVAVRRKMQLRAPGDESEEIAQQELETDNPEAAVAGSLGESEAPTGTESLISDGPPDGGRRKALVVAGALIAIFVIAMVGSANVGRSARSYGDEVVREYAQGDACTSAQIQLSLPAGDEMGPAIDRVFSALEGGTVIKAALTTKSQLLKVDFCESATSEEAVRAALRPLGVLAEK